MARGSHDKRTPREEEAPYSVKSVWEMSRYSNEAIFKKSASKALAETTVERVQDKPAYLTYHPVTDIPSLPLLPARSLVCLAGRVLEAPKVDHVNTTEGENDVPVAHLTLRASGNIVRVNFWRDTTALVERVEEGSLIFMSRLAKQWPRGSMDAKQHVELRATMRSQITSCPASLAAQLASTPSDATGAKNWSPTFTPEKIDYTTVTASWMSLSVLEGICSSKQIRDIHQVFQVPSVFLELGSLLTYEGCSACSKAWRQDAAPPCTCGASRVVLWRVKIGLRDATGQLQATCFDAFADVIKLYNDVAHDTEHVRPEDFVDGAMTDIVASYIGAVPFTARLTVGPDGWKENMQATVRLFAPTFVPQTGVLHPLKSLVVRGNGSGACPPVLVAATSYAPGIGMTEAHGSAIECFRSVVQFVDGPSDGGGAVDDRLQREVRCAGSLAKDSPALKVEYTGDASLLERFAGLPKDSCAHAICAWRTGEFLSVIAVMPIKPEEQQAFVRFFTEDVRIHLDSLSQGPSLQSAVEDTPLRIASAADRANLTSPPMWKARKLFPAVPTAGPEQAGA